MPNWVWLSTNNILRGIKLKLFHTNVKSVLLYGGEKWRSPKTYMKKLQVFHDNNLRIIRRFLWSNRITNEELLKITDEEKINTTIKKRKWR